MLREKKQTLDDGSLDPRANRDGAKGRLFNAPVASGHRQICLIWL